MLILNLVQQIICQCAMIRHKLLIMGNSDSPKHCTRAMLVELQLQSIAMHTCQSVLA